MKNKYPMKRKTFNKSKLIHLKPSAPIEKPTRPMQACTTSHHVLDCILVSDQDFLPLGRPIVCDIVDEDTQSICGFHIDFDPPPGALNATLLAMKNIKLNTKKRRKE